MGISSFGAASLSETPLFVACQKPFGQGVILPLESRELFDNRAAFG